MSLTSPTLTSRFVVFFLFVFFLPLVPPGKTLSQDISLPNQNDLEIALEICLILEIKTAE